MNPHHYDEILDEEGNKREPTFHYPPPANRGIYAFIWPYIEPFLVAWNKKVCKETDKLDEFGSPKRKFVSIKRFSHEGDLWCHFVDEAAKLNLGKKYVRSWVLINSKDLPILMKKVAHKDIKSLKETFPDEIIRNPYKRGQGGCMSKDHLEVFIENVK